MKYIRWRVTEIWPSEVFFQNGPWPPSWSWCNGNGAVRCAVLDNPTIERKTKSIRWRVAELWPFEVCHTLAGEWIPDNGDRRPYVILYSVQCCYAVHWTDNNTPWKKNWLLLDWCLEAVARPRQISQDRGQDRGSRVRDRDRGRGSENSASRRGSASRHHITGRNTVCHMGCQCALTTSLSPRQ